MNLDTNDIHILNAVKKSLIERGKAEDAENIDVAMDTLRTPVGIEARRSIKGSNFVDAPIMLEILDLLEGKGYKNAFVGHGIITHSRISSFVSDRDFLETEAATRELLPVPCWHWNLNTALWAVRSCLHLTGDCVELGVFKGHTVLFLHEYMRRTNLPQKDWHLYDTFDGVPDDQVNNAWWKDANRAYKGTYSYDEVCQRFAAFPRVKVIKGRVPEAFETDPLPDAICFAHIDMNSAKAEACGLQAVFERLATGGMILLDDHGWSQCTEQHEAHTQWALEVGTTILELPTGQGLVVKN